MYFDISRLIQQQSKENVFHEIGYDILLFLFYSIEFYFIVCISDAVIKEVNCGIS